MGLLDFKNHQLPVIHINVFLIEFNFEQIQINFKINFILFQI